MNDNFSFRTALAGCLSPILILLAACGQQGGQAGSAEEAPLAGAAIGGSFSLINQNGEWVTDQTFAGKYRLMYFGYTFCPDVCPVDLQRLMAGYRLLEKQAPEVAAKLQPIFITIDPERDTPDVMKSYVAAFHPKLMGLTGTPAEIADVAKRYAIVYGKAEGSGTTDYLMDHSNQTYLFGPDGKPIALIPQDGTAEAIEGELQRWIK